MADPTPAQASWVVKADDPSGESSPVRLVLRDGSLNLASLGKVELEAGQLVLAGDVYENGALVLPESGFEFAPVTQEVDAPGLGQLTVGITISPIGPGSGSLTPGGEASLSLPLEAKLEASLGGSVLIGPEADCYLRPVQFNLAGSQDLTARTMEVSSDRVSLPAVSAGCGSLGTIVDSLLGLPRDDIGTAFAFDVERTEPACAEGEVGSPPDCRVARVDLGAPKLELSRQKVKSGGKFELKVKVKNRGEMAAGKVKVCLDVPRKVIVGKARRCQVISSIGAGRTGTLKFKLRAKKVRSRKQVRLKVSSPVGDGTSRRTVGQKLTVKPRH